MKNILITILFICSSLAAHGQYMDAQLTSTEKEASTDTILKHKEKKSFIDRLPKPLRWIANNWSDYDPEYCTPCAYDWVVQAQNTSSLEWLNMKTDDGTEIHMRSKASHKIGPYLGYSFLMYGYTVDINALKGSHRRNEFTLSINSNLVNIDLIRRRTGGDFITTSLVGANIDPTNNQIRLTDMTSMAKAMNNQEDIGSLVDYDITGFNLNFFLNHRRYSNPAAFTNGAIQIKSAGSWIFGLGYTRQKISSDVNDAIVNYGLNDILSNKNEFTAEQSAYLYNLVKEDTHRDFNDFSEFASYLTTLYDTDIDAYKSMVSKLLNNQLLRPYLFGKLNANGQLQDYGMLPILLNSMPSVCTIDDWSVHIGYGYNLVLSRRLLFGISLIASPGIKRVKYDNRWSLVGLVPGELANALNDYYNTPNLFKADYFIVNEAHSKFGCNFFGRASLTYTHDRWRAGFNINATSWLLRSHDLHISNTYGAAIIYVGYCFGHRKKMYRKGESDYDTYLKIIK